MRINEVVIDAGDKFAKRQEKVKQARGQDFVKKITNIAGQIPGAMDRQKELEKFAATELKKIELYPNKVFNADRAQLAALSTWFNPGTSILHVLEFSVDNDSGIVDEKHSKRVDQIARNFIHLNIDKIFQTINEQEEMLRELRFKLNGFKWYAPWERYTNYRYVVHDLQRNKEFFKKFQNLA